MRRPVSRSRHPSTSEPAELGTGPDAESVDPVKREEQARALCLRLLTARARTRSELQTHLDKRGYPGEVSTQVLDRLTQVGLLDDADFGEDPEAYIAAGTEIAGRLAVFFGKLPGIFLFTKKITCSFILGFVTVAGGCAVCLRANLRKTSLPKRWSL